MNSDTAKGLGIGILVGAAVGLVVGLLYAPKSGAETREMIKDKASEWKDKAGAAFHRGKKDEMAEVA